MIPNLSSDNIRRDEGNISIEVLRTLEGGRSITLPPIYVDFIIAHNGARLRTRIFAYNDIQSGERLRSSIAFSKAEQISNDIALLQSNNEGPDMVGYFEDGLIPFGETGGGDMICFDYRDNPETNDPPIVLWDHEVGFKDGVFFIANNFEEFVNMLHEPEDE